MAPLLGRKIGERNGNRTGVVADSSAASIADDNSNFLIEAP